jgi:hypothetical protein
MLAACGRKDSKETAAEDQVKQEDQVTQGTSTEKKDTVSENSDDTIPENSILNFNNDAGYARLQSDMKNGDYPLECNVLYDEGGERPDVTVTDEKVIREIYGLLADVTVGDKSDMSVTDMYHRVTFRLRNDTYVSFNFEGEDLFCWGQDNYDVENSSNLWYHVRQLQDAKMTAADTASSSENGQSEASAASKTSKSADASGAEASSMSKSSEVTYEQEAIDLFLESPCFGLTWDIGHSKAVGEKDVPFILSRRDRLVHFHIHDGSEQPPRNHLALGDGEINLAERLDLAESRGCRCVLETKTIDALTRSVGWLAENR